MNGTNSQRPISSNNFSNVRFLSIQSLKNGSSNENLENTGTESKHPAKWGMRMRLQQ